MPGFCRSGRPYTHKNHFSYYQIDQLGHWGATPLKIVYEVSNHCDFLLDF